MRGTFVLSVVFLLAAGCASEDASDAFEERARETVEAIFDGRYADVRADFDETMSARLSEQGLADGRAQFEAMFGSFESMGRAEIVNRGELTVVNIPLHLSAGEGEARVTYDREGKIAGLFLLRQGVPVP